MMKDRSAERATDRAYYKKNKDAILLRLKAARKCDEYRAKRRAWYAKNKDHINALALKRRGGPPVRKTKEQKQERYRNYRLKYDYGITLDRYRELYAIQKGRCAICNEKFPDSGRGGLCVDHCHDSGSIRGLLCKHCNLWIGIIKTAKRAQEFAKKMANYLREAPTAKNGSFR